MISAIMTAMTGRIQQPTYVTPSVEKAEVKVAESPSEAFKVSISNEAKQVQQGKVTRSNFYNQKGNYAGKISENGDAPSKSGRSGEEKTSSAQKYGQELTEEEQAKVDELQQRDKEVRQHEAQHKAAGAPYTSGPYFEYETGPDSKRYVTGGHVEIDTSEIEGDPQATIEKAQKLRQAATAPGEMSSSDRAAAAKASQMEAEARRELREVRQEKQTNQETAQGGFHKNALNAYGMAQAADTQSESRINALL